MAEPFRNRLYFGDNLKVLRGEFDVPGVPPIEDNSVDLIYLDPPFNSNRNYNLLFKQQKGEPSAAQIMAFEDTWQYDPRVYEEFKSDKRNAKLHKLVSSLFEILGKSEMMAYVLMMAPRLLVLHEKLKPTGSLFLHCDPTASHYLKVILDVLFEPVNFRNEVIWQRTNAHNNVAKHYSRLHDVLLFYRKSKDFKWHPPRTDFSAAQLKRYKPDPNEDGRLFTGQDLTITGDGRFGREEWRGAQPPANRSWAYSLEEREAWFEEGLILMTKDGRVRLDGLKVWLDEKKGKVLGDVWTDIKRVGNTSPERRGYPTQKPLALLERIIASCTDPDDVVLDPFAGCGTAVVQAERMDRHWIGIDITYLAINEILDRLHTEKVEGKPLVFDLYGTPKDFHSAQKLFEQTAKQNHKPFEQWACTLVGARWNEKKGADRGIDGRIGLWDPEYREALIQVKGGALTLSTVRDFANVIESNDAVLGIMLTMRRPTPEMQLVADEMGDAKWPSKRKYPRLQIISIEDILENGVEAKVPDAYTAPKQRGVGMALPKDASLFEEEADGEAAKEEVLAILREPLPERPERK